MARVPAPWIKGVPRGSPRGLRISANNAGEHKDVSVVLLAGGRGKRMGAPIPKQYLEVRDKPLATRSFYALANIPSVLEMVVVCEPEFEHVFPRELPGTQTEVKFARPGEERQDSVFSGYSVVANDASLVCIHDSARPLVDPSRADAAVEDARQHGCSALGAPVKATIKQADPDSLMVSRTLDRSTLWEMHTPQVVESGTLGKALGEAKRMGTVVTDDASLVELLGLPVKITPDRHDNVKVTTPDDISFVDRALEEEGDQPSSSSSVPYVET